MKFIGNRLRLMRKNNKETQWDVAIAIGTTAGLVSQWETGVRIPNTHFLTAIAMHFDKKIDYFFE